MNIRQVDLFVFKLMQPSHF